MSESGIIKPWLSLMRLSNLPTVWSNTLHGLVAGYVVGISVAYGEVPLMLQGDLLVFLDQGFVLLVAMSLIYSGGMILNDVCDAKIDAAERPARPIPSGRVGRGVACIVAVCMLAVGVAITCVYPRPIAIMGFAVRGVPLLAAALVFCVVSYNLFHRYRLVGFALMPACRALVILCAAMAFPIGIGGGEWWSHVGAPAAALALWTAMVILVAWGEATRPGRPRFIGWMIAAMPLLDAGFLVWLGAWPVAAFSVACAALTFVGQRWIKGS